MCVCVYASNEDFNRAQPINYYFFVRIRLVYRSVVRYLALLRAAIGFSENCGFRGCPCNKNKTLEQIELKLFFSASFDENSHFFARKWFASTETQASHFTELHGHRCCFCATVIRIQTNLNHHFCNVFPNSLRYTHRARPLS